ncbi:MAG: ABC transporter ATP-binding protein [Deltaproteobacteria bacterium]|nr:ABC transporter ATP-binding protein [Deltaproteobacteria bacterium]
MLLQIVNITKSFDAPVFKDVSFSLKKGEFLTIVGLSGSGKTTLLKIVAGIETPDSGIVLLDNNPVSQIPGKIILVFQNYALWPHLTVIENLMLPLTNKGLRKEHALSKARASLSLLQISHLEHKYPSQISGGQQQRVALARAIAFEPDFILFDEPLANLDPQLRRTAVTDLKTLLEKLKIGSIMVTHNIDDVLEFSDSFAVLHGGKFYGPQSFDEFYFRPPSMDIASIFGQITFIKTAKEIIGTRPEFITIKLGNDYTVESITRRKSNYIIKASKDQVRTTIETSAIPEWLAEGTKVSLSVRDDLIFSRTSLV